MLQAVEPVTERVSSGTLGGERRFGPLFVLLSPLGP
jgi:hypothetical protein